MDRAGGHARKGQSRVGAVVLALLGMLAVGCGQSSAELKLAGVVPQQIPFGVSARVRLHGSFVPRLAVDLEDATATTLDDTFTVEVGSVVATEVHFLGPDELEIVIPKGLEMGTQRMLVTDPRGQRAVMEDAVEVVMSPPARIAFSQPATTAIAGQWTAPIRVSFQDANGLPSRTVKAQTAVRVWTDSPTGQLGLDYGQGQPSLQLLLLSGSDGFNFIYTDLTPGLHTLYVSAESLPIISAPVTVGSLGEPAQVSFVLPEVPLVATGVPLEVAVELEDANGTAVSPQQPVDVSLSVTTPGAGLALSPQGPFVPSLTVRVESAGARSPFYLLAPRPLSGAAVRGTASLPGRPLAPGTLSLPVTPEQEAGFEGRGP